MSHSADNPNLMEALVSLAKRRGFIYQSSEIYGGLNGFFDYGPLGVELKKNIKDAWWQDMVRNPPPGPDGQEIRMAWQRIGNEALASAGHRDRIDMRR